MLVPLIVLLQLLCSCVCFDLKYNVEEGRPAGTYVGDIETDSSVMDSVASKDRNLIRFSQMQQTATSFFKITETTGKLYTAQEIDAEAICAQNKDCYQLIEVVVRKKELFLKLLVIKINIVDINDNKPEFPSKEIKIEFPENESDLKASLPNAVDKDINSKHSKISYSLKDNMEGTFRIQTNPLSLSLANKLDREQQHSYNLQVVAKDQSFPYKEGVLNVHVSVSDVNDNAPIFSRRFYNGSTENEAQELVPIVTVQAKDSDEGINGKVSYYISARTSDLHRANFIIDKKSGSIFLKKKIMMPHSSAIRLIVEAKDSAIASLKSNATVQINIVHTKNNPPLIKINFVSSASKDSAEILEGAHIGSVIAYLKAIDVDRGLNGEVTCSLENDDIQLHQLGETIYTIVVKEEIDRERNTLYSIIVSCQDKGSPPLTSERAIMIRVKDANDNRPYFPLSHYTVSLQENNEVGLPIAHVSALDVDVGPNAQLKYFLGSEVTSMFTIDEQTGIISVQKVFDREKTASTEFYVFAKDLGKTSLTGSTLMSVKILDINDVFPSVSVEQFQFKVNENAPSNSPVGRIHATDSDLGLGAQLKFSLLHSQSYFPFSIDNSGFITITEALDYERKIMYQFQVAISDNGIPPLKTIVNVVVEVVDMNDNAPTFVFPSQRHVSLSTRYIQSTKNNITMLRATDKDSGLNAFLKYKIVSGNNKQLFDLNIYSGVISFRRPAVPSDYGTYNLECMVKDSGSPALSASVYVSILLLATNDTRQNVIPQPTAPKEPAQDSLLIIVLVLVTLFVVAAVIGIIWYIRRNDRRKMNSSMLVKQAAKYGRKMTVCESLPPDVASEIWKDLGKFRSNVIKSSNLSPEDEAELEASGEVPECTVEYVIGDRKNSDVKMNLLVNPDRRRSRMSSRGSIIDYGNESPAAQMQQLAAALQMVAPLGEMVRRLSMVSFGSEDRREDGAQGTGERKDSLFPGRL